jgi:hypothetical protein
MAKKVFSVFTLFLLADFLISCATTRPSLSRDEAKVPMSLTIQAEKFPEVLLKEKDGISKIVKILRLERGKVVFLPSPYWNVQPEAIDLEQISSIDLTEVKRKGVGWFLGGLFLGFYSVGINGLSTSHYNVDYEAAISNSYFAAVGGGMLGMAIGGFFDPRPRTKFNFSKMSTAAKVLALKNIMGAIETRRP